MYHQVSNSTGQNYNARIYSDTRFAPHFHRSYELIHVLSGSIAVQVDGADSTLEAGETLLIPPYAVHALEGNPDVQCWVGVFSRDRVFSALPESLSQYRQAFRCEPEVERFLRQTLFVRQTPSDLQLGACLCLAADQCLKHALSVPSEHSTLRQSMVSYIAERFREEISLKTMAEDLGYEYHYLSRVFHRCFALNFREYLNGYRFEHAYELLQKTDLTVEEVALASGFQSARNLDRVFRRMSGKSPRDCRRS